MPAALLLKRRNGFQWLLPSRLPLVSKVKRSDVYIIVTARYVAITCLSIINCL